MMVQIFESTEDTAEVIITVAQRQKKLIELLLLYLVLWVLGIVVSLAIMKRNETIGAIFLIGFAIVLQVIYLICIFKLAKALGCNPWLYVFLMLLGGIFAIISLLLLNSKATHFLKRNGIRVGFMGANKDDMRKYYERTMHVIKKGNTE